MKEDYISKIKKIYVIEPGVMDKMNWFVILAGAAGTVLCTLAFIYWVIRLGIFIFEVSIAKTKIHDKRFWRNMGISLLIIILIMSGSVFGILSQFYDFMTLWGWN